MYACMNVISFFFTCTCTSKLYNMYKYLYLSYGISENDKYHRSGILHQIEKGV